jgi:CspA family cold shock protein
MDNSNTVYFGEVIWFNTKRGPNQGIGFLQWEIDGVRQKDMFVHFSDIVCDGFKVLLKGQKVSFQIGQNYHGQPKAINVTVIG